MEEEHAALHNARVNACGHANCMMPKLLLRAALLSPEARLSASVQLLYLALICSNARP